jgi:hypothetical protein
MPPPLHQTFNGTIWRFEIDELSGILCAEIRLNEDRRVYFASLNINTAEVYFNDLTAPERWFTGIEAVYDGVLLLHNDQSETGPVHKGIVAVDAVTGAVLWSNYTFAFDHLSVDGPIVYDTQVQPKKLFLVDIKTGATTRIYPPQVHKQLDNSIVLPGMVQANVIDLQPLQLHPYGNIVHYLEYNNYRIVSLHALKGGQLTQHLYLIADNIVVYEDLLNDAIQKIQPEAFILHKNRLIYIRNRNELKVLIL